MRAVGRRQVVALGMALTTGSIGSARGQGTWPNRPVRLVVPFAAGGATDVTARAVSGHLAAVFGHPFVVDNRPGAAGKIGTEFAAKANDDHVLLVANPSSHTLPWLVDRRPTFDPVKDFQPIVQMGTATLFLAVHAGVPARNVQEFLAYARSHPGKLSYASIGEGSAQHFVTELLKQRAGVSMVHIPYRGEAPAINDLLGGTIDVYFVATAKRFDGEPRVRVLGVAAPERWFNMPQVPTFAEQGIRDFTFDAWNGLVAPKVVAPEVVQRLNVAVNEALRMPPVIEAMERLGYRPLGGTSAVLARRIEADVRTYRPLIEQKVIRLVD